MRHRSFLVAFFLAIALFAHGAARAAWYDPVPHEEMCKRGEFLVALQAKLASDWGAPSFAPHTNSGIQSVTPICAPWLSAERKFGNTYALTPVGWSYDTTADNIFAVTTESCPLYGVIKAIHFQWTRVFDFVWNISIDCVMPAATEAVIDTQSELVSMPPADTHLATGCPVGDVAVGVNLFTQGLDADTNADDTPLETIQLTCAEPNGWTENPRVVAQIAIALGSFVSPSVTGIDRAAYLRSLAAQRTHVPLSKLGRLLSSQQASTGPADQTFNVKCTSSGEACNVPAAVNLPDGSWTVRVFAPAAHCSPIDYRLTTDNRGDLIGDSGPLAPGAGSPTMTVPVTTRQIYISATGITGGCNKGTLSGWDVVVRLTPR